MGPCTPATGTSRAADVDLAGRDPVDLVWFPKVLETGSQTGIQTLQASWRQEVWKPHRISNFYYFFFSLLSLG